MPAASPRIPEIIAHRGAPREALENTLPAFARALELGADAIELDVHATADDVLVVHHDPVVPVPAPGGPVWTPIRSLTAREVCAAPLRDDARVPTLDAVCALVGDRAVLYVEVKAIDIAPLVARHLERFPQVRQAVHAFDHRLPVAVRALRPATAVGVLSTSYPIDVASFVGPARPDAVWQHALLIDESFVRAVHALGARVIAWTENDVPHARELAAWGVDGICTDVPGVMRQAFGPVSR